VGLLGDLQPIEGSSQTWQWVIDQLKSYPRELAHQAGNMFIHKQLYREVMPPSMRSAFGVSSMYSLINDSNRASLFRILDAEVFALLELSEDSSLLDELARLQALVLYQTIRLFHGGVEQRFTAEQQQSLVMSWAMKLLSRAEAELRHLESEKYTSWMLAESIRRTALVVYMLYGVNSIVREGFCVGFPTLSKLPVSTTPTYWDSEAAYRVCTESASVTLTYENFTDLWLVSTPKTLQPLEKFLLIPCKGLDIVELYSNTEMLEA
jgi:hypothetical protein